METINTLEQSKEALILHLQRLSTEDGPGLRTTVFFKKCLLNCEWCHNPESIPGEKQLQWLESRCINCQTCVELCSQDALSFTDEGLQINRQRCDLCESCVKNCPTLALEMLGQQIRLDELLQEVIKDRAFFEKSEDGGVTVSGGEPMLQAEFVAAFLKAMQAEGISTALDTCGLCSQANLDKVLPYADIILFDIKLMNAALHKEHTGQSNEQILQNLLHVRDHIQQSEQPKRLWLRTPLIPGATASKENIRAIGKFISKNLNGLVERWELLAFNNLASDKFKRLGMQWKYADVPLMRQNELNDLEQTAHESGVDSRIVIVSGAVRVEE